MESMNKSRLMWACRRGMLELDILLGHFAEEVYLELQPEEQHLFCELLACDDPELWSWFSKQNIAPEPFQVLVEKILKYSIIRLQTMHHE